MRIVLIHGFKASPQHNFWPWLSSALRERGHEVIIVALPNPEAPICSEWVDAISQSILRPGGDTIFIAHSLGCVALLHYLENAEMSGTPKSVILVSPPFRIGSETFRSFFEPPIDFDTVMWKGQEFAIIAAKDDDVIPFDHAQKYERELNGHLHALESGKHFFDAKELPLILELIDDRNSEPGATLPNDFSDIDVVV
ncbi:MAG: alpha/beta fold hydrolase [Patescibacteria group bacterium]